MATQIKSLILRYLSYFWKAKSKSKSEATDPVAMSSGKTNSNQYTVGEFFSGIGGTRLGVEQAGFKVVVSSEIDSHCIKTYEDNFNETPLGDIKSILAKDLPDFTVLTASTPCQSFSTQGKRLGLKDERGQLIDDVFKKIDEKNPRVVFIENVKGLKTTNNGENLKYILENLKDRGYYVHYKILKASNYGVPQNRERLFIVGFSEDVPFKFPMPTTLPALSGGILEDKVDENYFLTQSEIDTQVAAKVRYEKKGSGFGFKILDPKKSANTLLKSSSSLLKNIVAVKVQKNTPAGRGVHEIVRPNRKKSDDFNLRKLTPRECARLQGFPDDYKLTSSASQTYSQMGNSVPVPVVREIFKEILVSLVQWDNGVKTKHATIKRIDPASPAKKAKQKKSQLVVAKKVKAPKIKIKKKTAKSIQMQNSNPPAILPQKHSLSLVKNKSLPPVFPAILAEPNQENAQKVKLWHEKDKNNHFMTPAWLVTFIKAIVPLELDAASSEEANSIHQFKKYFDNKINGLSQSWKVTSGSGVFVNPPYDNLLEWAEKCSEEVSKNKQPIFLLVPAKATETKWFRTCFANATHIVFLKKRLIHNEAISKTSAHWPSALVVFGGDTLDDKIEFLSELGECMETSAYRKQKEKTNQRKVGHLKLSA